MKDMNVAKFTADDFLLFSNIILDLFPGTEVPVIDNEDLTAVVESQFLEQGLQVYLFIYFVQLIQQDIEHVKNCIA
jgi:dynein heavy chain